MNIGIVARPNSKGQIVIPKKFRDELGIEEGVLLNLTLRGNGVYISPIEKTVASSPSREMSFEILKKTAGAWGGDTWEETDEKRHEIEIEASKTRKRAW